MLRGVATRLTNVVTGRAQSGRAAKSTALGNHHASAPSRTPFTQSRRHVSVGAIPTDLRAGEAGHVMLELRSSEREELSLKSSEVGHHDDVVTTLRRAEVTARSGVPYTNLEHKAAKLGTPYPNRPTVTTDLGHLKPKQLDILKRHLDNWPRRYSLSGSSVGPVRKEHATKLDFCNFILSGTVPKWAENCCDPIAALAMDWARSECSDPQALRRFEKELGAATLPQQVRAVLARHFEPNLYGFMTFVPGDVAVAKPNEGTGLKDTPFYETYSQASGLDKKAFARLAQELEEKGVFFRAVFSDPKYMNWGLEMFLALGKELTNCTGPDDAVGFVAYHPDCYDGGVMHRSMFTIDREGLLTISHHESIELESDAPPLVNNLMVRARGLPANTYDTKGHFEHVRTRANGKVPEVLPVMRSFNVSPPAMMVTRVTKNSAFREFVDRNNAVSLSPAGLQATYSSDPDERSAETIAGLRRGFLDLDKLLAEMGEDWNSPVDPAVLDKWFGPRFKHEPWLDTWGQATSAANGLYVNNCSHYTGLGLLKAGAVNLGGKILDETSSLAEVIDFFESLQLQPGTAPGLSQRADAAGFRMTKDGHVERHAASFKIIGSYGGLNDDPANQTHGADVPMNEFEDPQERERLRQANLAGGEMARAKNEQTFQDFFQGKEQPGQEKPPSKRRSDV